MNDEIWTPFPFLVTVPVQLADGSKIELEYEVYVPGDDMARALICAKILFRKQFGSEELEESEEQEEPGDDPDDPEEK